MKGVIHEAIFKFSSNKAGRNEYGGRSQPQSSNFYKLENDSDLHFIEVTKEFFLTKKPLSRLNSLIPKPLVLKNSKVSVNPAVSVRLNH